MGLCGTLDEKSIQSSVKFDTTLVSFQDEFTSSSDTFDETQLSRLENSAA